MRLSVLAAVLCLGTIPALAQTTPTPQASAEAQQEALRIMHRAGRNQLGVLEYCRAQGSVGEDIVALQRRLLGLLPATQVEGLDEAEATGRRGIVDFNGNQIVLADAARTQNTTPDAMCKQMASVLQAQAAQLPR